MRPIHGGPRSGTQGALRSIALFEAFKGLAALLLGVGLVELLHHDLRHLVLELVGHFGLDVAQPFPALLLRCVDVLNNTPLASLELLLGTYLAIRLTEAYGLWRQEAWAEWLGALSGGLYIPFELQHLWHEPSALSAGVLTVNALIVGFLAAQLWRRRPGTGPGA
ncbi:MAG: DUF2127 domain-containing protein [Limnohabitans sp.]